MNKELTEISPDLTIPGCDVTVHNPHSCQVRSQDGRYGFSVWIGSEWEFPMRISGSILSESFSLKAWGGGGDTVSTRDVDDVITEVATLLKLMDKLSSEGFSAKIDGRCIVLSHPSKPDYELRMSLADAQRTVGLKNDLLYTRVEYRGPAYDAEANTKWQLSSIDTKWQPSSIDSSRLIVTNKGLEELAQEIKTRILSMGEEKDPRITQWVSEEIEKELRSQGFTFTPKPEEGIVKFSHPAGVSGSLSFAPFTFSEGYGFDENPKYPNPQFPTDIEREKVVLFTLDRPNSREPYTKGFLAKNPQEVIHEFRRFLALPLVYQEVCKAWKSDILVPKLNGDSLQLVNTKIEGNGSIILELTVKKDKLRLKSSGKTYKISDDPGKIAQTIVGLAEKHVQEFIQANGLTTKITEIDF